VDLIDDPDSMSKIRQIQEVRQLLNIATKQPKESQTLRLQCCTAKQTERDLPTARCDYADLLLKICLSMFIDVNTS
jgi:hypothetical protein